jgi:BRCT domain type II-containing protein
MIVRTTKTAMMIKLIGSEDEEDAVEEDLDDVDSMYDVADAGDHGEPENADDEHSETGENTDEETNVFQGKDFTGAGHLPTLLELAERI